MNIEKILAVLSGLLAISAFFFPMLTINGEHVTLFSQGYLSGFAFIAFGIGTIFLALLDKMKWIIWPAFGLMLSGVAFTEKLKETLAETVESYEKFKEYLAGQADTLGVEVEKAKDLEVVWGYGVEIAMAASALALAAYFVVHIVKNPKKTEKAVAGTDESSDPNAHG